MTLRVIVPSYNCEPWIERCLDSILFQTYRNYEVSVIDDASIDGQTEIMEAYCAARGWNWRINAVNMGAGYNIHEAMYGDFDWEYDDPVIIVDGDDFLAHAGVFDRVAEIYEDPDVWMMWSKYEPHPYSTGQTQSADYPYDITKDRSYRQHGNILNHLITFRSFLYMESITPSDLQLADGLWAKAGYDRMICIPMLERAGPKHTLFVPEVMYMYNAVNPNSDVHVRLVEAQQAHAVVASLPKKPPLDEARVDALRLTDAD